MGSVTRPHDDIDFAVWRDDLPRIRELLAAHEWRHAPEPDEDGGTGYERHGVRVELTFLVRDADGEIFIPLRDRRASWSADALGYDVRELLGVQVRVISLATLIHGKSAPRDEPEEAAKDRADYRVLSEL